MAGPSIGEAVRYLTDFVQGATLSELKAGEGIEALEEVDYEKLSRIGDAPMLTKLFDVAHSYIKSHVHGKKKLSKQASGTLALMLATIAKLEFYANEKGSHRFSPVTSLPTYRQLKKLVFECESDRLHGQREFLDHIKRVKEDLHYELFSIRKANGERFFSSRLGPELHDAIDLDHLEDGDSSLAPVLSFKEMYDNDLQHLCESAMQRCKEELNAFLRADYVSGRLCEVALFLRKAVMASVLCARRKNTLLNIPVKASSYYFKDTLFFLRKVVSDSTFLKVSEKPDSEEERALVTLAWALCHAFVMRTADDHSSFSIVSDLIERGSLRLNKRGAETMKCEYKAFNAELDHYLHGPLIRAWDFLGEIDEDLIFDPWINGFLPSRLGTFTTGSKLSAFLRMPSPTMQSHVQRAAIIHEYRGFLLQDPYQTHLVINLQSKEREGEKARSLAIEELANSNEFKGQLYLARLSKNSDLYDVAGGVASATGRYSRASSLIEGLSKSIALSKGLDLKIEGSLITEAFHLAHIHFLKGKKGLDINERKLLIDLGYAFLALKFIRELGPTSVSIVCKDGVDKTGSLCALMASVMHETGAGISAHKLHVLLRRLIFEVPMCIRERAMAKIDFDRLFETSELLKEGLSKKKAKEAILSYLDGLSFGV
jgi:hypothetical protein